MLSSELISCWCENKPISCAMWIMMWLYQIELKPTPSRVSWQKFVFILDVEKEAYPRSGLTNNLMSEIFHVLLNHNLEIMCHIVPLRFRHPEFVSRLEELSRSHTSLALPLHFLSTILFCHNKRPKRFRGNVTILQDAVFLRMYTMWFLQKCEIFRKVSMQCDL